MLWYSDAAVNYAIAECADRANFQVVIFHPWNTLYKEEFVSRLKNMEPQILRTRYSATTMDVTFKNGSRICWASPSDSSRGRKAHLCIVNKDTPDEIIDNIIRPCEILEWVERHSKTIN